jgi:hypothetical protein
MREPRLSRPFPSRSFLLSPIVLIAILFLIWFAPAVTTQTTAAQGRAGGVDGVPGFLQVNKRYVVRWDPGDVETYKVLEIRDGWVKAESEAKDAPSRLVLWLNPARAMTIQELP